MDVILQIGAHRTATTSFQMYLRQHNAELGEMGVGFWGPLRLRKGMFHGIIPAPELGIGPLDFARAQGRLGLQMARAHHRGLKQIVVSDENMLGIMRRNFTAQQLYPAAGERIARYVAAFGGAVGAIHLTIRCLSSYWPSAFSHCIPRGAQVPSMSRLSALAQSRRSWRDVIMDIAAAAPNLPLFVSTFEQHAARPHRILAYLLGEIAPIPQAPIWRNQRPSLQDLLQLPLQELEQAQLLSQTHRDRWEPFTQAQSAALQETYADDLFWLRSGADGLAHLLEDPKSTQMGYPTPLHFENKGQTHDQRHRLARPG
ncbi:hypothetical protein [Planktotalea sp.]|uniref:hypothetical protein n=1 Tax=Planktotalea sp. TaxID=2029877 RepID=UPI003D6C6EC6